MSCSCSCVGWHGDMETPSVYEEKTVTARATDRCCGCGSPIVPGQRVYRISGCWSGEWSHYSYHECCYDALKLTRDLEDWDSYALGCRIDGCLGIILDGAVWPRDAERVEVASAVIDVMEEDNDD